jgi:type I restriction-modification system DNA methylase subunit
MRGGKAQTGKCPVCNVLYTDGNWKSRHHILPKRFFGGIGGLFELCRDCHNELEKLIPYNTKLTEFEYRDILADFVINRQLKLKENQEKEQKIAA